MRTNKLVRGLGVALMINALWWLVFHLLFPEHGWEALLGSTVGTALGTTFWFWRALRTGSAES